MDFSEQEQQQTLTEVREHFISQWGALGTQWGINKTMAQIHALLMVMPQPLNTDEVMDHLSVSRGNAHTNLKELVGWGLVRVIAKKGERKEFFEAEKDVWKIFITVLRERQRREIDPALELLQDCERHSKDMQGKEAEAFFQQIQELQNFVALARTIGTKVEQLSYTPAMKLAAKILGR